MKIELTEDEVREVGGSRYNPGRKFAVIWALSLIVMIIALIFIPRKDAAWWNFVPVIIPLAVFLGMYILLMRKQTAAGRRFLEEQKKLQDGGHIFKSKLFRDTEEQLGYAEPSDTNHSTED